MSNEIFAALPHLDHVALCVRSLQHAKSHYTEQLAFTLFPEGKHPQYGTQNSGMWFKDNTYVELLTFFDKEKAPWLAEFLERYEGCLFFVLKVTSIDSLAENLRAAGFPVQDPQSGTIEYEGGDIPVGTKWKTLFLPHTSILGRVMIFIEYATPKDAAPPFQKYSEHPNAASRLSKVFIAVHDIQNVKNEFKKLGFKVGVAAELEEFGAISHKISLGNKTHIVLLTPSKKNKEGSLKMFLDSRGEGVFGFSIQVKNFHQTISSMHQQFLGFAIGTEGKGKIWLPPQVTHGAWIELYQK